MHRLFAVVMVIWAAGTDLRAQVAFDKTRFETYARYLMLWGKDVEVALGDPSPSSIPDLDAFEVRASIKGNVVQTERFYISRDRGQIIRGSIYDLAANPFQPILSRMSLHDAPRYGSPGAPVTIVVYSDFQCPFCSGLAKSLKTNLATAYPNTVQVYFKDSPAPFMHGWSMMAAIGGRCVYQQDPSSFWRYHDWVFDHQSQINAANLRAKILEAVDPAKVDAERLTSCLDAKATEAEVTASMEEARALGVQGTPTAFVNGRILGGARWELLKMAIDFELNPDMHPGANDCHCIAPTESGVSRKDGHRD